MTKKSNSTKYTAATSKIARKMSGEIAQRTLVREHKRIPKFDKANLEVSKVYKNLALLLTLSFLSILFFCVTIIKFKL